MKRLNSVRRELKIVVLTACFLTAMCSSLHAQRMLVAPKDRAAVLKKQLGLSDDQTAAITKIYEEAQQQTKKAFDRSGGDRQATMSEVRRLMGNADLKIDILLTADQKEKFREIRKQRKSRTREGSR